MAYVCLDLGQRGLGGVAMAPGRPRQSPGELGTGKRHVLVDDA